MPSWPLALVGVAMERSVIRWLHGRPRWRRCWPPGASAGVDAGRALAVRRAERAGGEPGPDCRIGIAVMSNPTLPQPHRHHCLRGAGAGGRGAADPRARGGPVHVRGVTQNRRMASCVASTPRRHLRLRARFGHRRPGRAARSQIGNVGPVWARATSFDSFPGRRARAVSASSPAPSTPRSAPRAQISCSKAGPARCWPDHGAHVFIVIFIQKRAARHLRDEGAECRGMTKSHSVRAGQWPSKPLRAYELAEGAELSAPSRAFDGPRATDGRQAAANPALTGQRCDLRIAHDR